MRSASSTRMSCKMQRPTSSATALLTVLGESCICAGQEGEDLICTATPSCSTVLTLSPWPIWFHNVVLLVGLVLLASLLHETSHLLFSLPVTLGSISTGLHYLSRRPQYWGSNISPLCHVQQTFGASVEH